LMNQLKIEAAKVKKPIIKFKLVKGNALSTSKMLFISKSEPQARKDLLTYLCEVKKIAIMTDDMEFFKKSNKNPSKAINIAFDCSAGKIKTILNIPSLETKRIEYKPAYLKSPAVKIKK